MLPSSAGCQQLTAYIATVPDSALTASSEYVNTVHPEDQGPASQSRLFASSTNVTVVAGWAAGVSFTGFEYIQVRELKVDRKLLNNTSIFRSHMHKKIGVFV